MKKCFILGTVCLILWGCMAKAPQARTIVNTFPIQGSFDPLWQAVIETFADLNLPIDNMEKDSGLITTDWIDFTGQTNEGYCDCGKLGVDREENREGKFNVFVKRIDAISCEVKVNCVYQQKHYSPLDGKSYTRQCISTGILEAGIFDLIRSKVGRHER
jgi:hypothetical protein